MTAYVISFTEQDEFQTMTLYVSEQGKLQEFINKIIDSGGEVHEIKLAEQQGKTKP